jgi:hypothetical protein
MPAPQKVDPLDRVDAVFKDVLQPASKAHVRILAGDLRGELLLTAWQWAAIVTCGTRVHMVLAIFIGFFSSAGVLHQE